MDIKIAILSISNVSIPDDMDPQFAADNLSVEVSSDEDEIGVGSVSVKSSMVVTEPTPEMIWCPNCGHHHTPAPYTYRMENEFESFQEQLEGDEFQKEGEGEDMVVTLPGCFIEAGPYNNDRYLVEQNLDLFSCPACNKTFAKE